MLYDYSHQCKQISKQRQLYFDLWKQTLNENDPRDGKPSRAVKND